jgi:hypothetical protein
VPCREQSGDHVPAALAIVVESFELRSRGRALALF